MAPRYMIVDPGMQLVRLGSPVIVAAGYALGEVTQRVYEFVDAVLDLLLELRQCRGILPEKVRAVKEESALRVVLMPLHHVEQIQAEGLILQKSTVGIPYEVPSPLFDVADLAADGIIQISDSSREQPRVSVHKNLVRRGKLASPLRSR